jgi:hypothetical protein
MASEVLPDRRQAGSLSYNALGSVEAMSQALSSAVFFTTTTRAIGGSSHPPIALGRPCEAEEDR